jgi:flagellar hook-associated protein 3 FlgL
MCRATRSSLGSGANSVFGALNSLMADYSSGTVDTTQAVSDTAALSTALNYVSQQRVTIDNSITQLSAASDAVTKRADQLTTAQTNLMQADMARSPRSFPWPRPSRRRSRM